MKKLVVFSMAALFSITAVNAQDKPKNSKQIRDSIFTEMKLSDENRQKMHDLIAESGKSGKQIKEDASLSDDEKKEKQKELSKQMKAKQAEILTPEQQKMWSEASAEIRRRNQAKK